MRAGARWCSCLECAEGPCTHKAGSGGPPCWGAPCGLQQGLERWSTLTGLRAWNCRADLLQAANCSTQHLSSVVRTTTHERFCLAGLTPQHIKAPAFQGQHTLLQCEQVECIADAVEGNVAEELGLCHTNLRRLDTRGGQSESMAFQGPAAPAC